MTLWQGRFGTEAPADELLAYTVSLPFDQRLAADDVTGSRAHVRGLAAAGILSHEDAQILLAALDRVAAELAAGSPVFKPADEDVHTGVERRVTEIAGEVGARLHTGRSRNDQIATDLRLFAKRELVVVARRIQDLQQVLLDRARAAEDAYLPGYTHLQRAQPVLLAHHLLAHGWALARDVDRLLDTRRRLDVSPLGAGALAGSSLPLEPDLVAAELGFAARFENSLDAVSDRDFVAEALFDLTLIGVHLSRLGEEIVLWCTEEFGFMHLADAYATGSSMLPQKKNPDIAELARGRCGRLIGHLTGLLATLKGLPLAYNRDLQEDKEPFFDALDQVVGGVVALTGLLATATWDTARNALPAGSYRGGRTGARCPRAPRSARRAGRGASLPGRRSGRTAGAGCGRHPADDTRRRGSRSGGHPDGTVRPSPRTAAHRPRWRCSVVDACRGRGTEARPPRWRPDCSTSWS